MLPPFARRQVHQGCKCRKGTTRAGARGGVYVSAMNALEPKSNGLAKLHYGDGEFAVMSPGRHVLCAVTGRQIPLEALRYWDADVQEAYAGPAEALAAWRARHGS